MVSYYTYRDLGGCKIANEDWHRYAVQAHAQLTRYRRIYTVIEPTPCAADMAVCAMADVLFDQEEALHQPVSASIGSVSTSYSQKLDTSAAALAGRLYRAASLHLDIHRGCCV